MWVGNWRECVVWLGAPPMLEFWLPSAPGERFLLDSPLGVATGGWFTCWRRTEELAVGKSLHNCQHLILCDEMLNPTLDPVICAVRWYLEGYGNVLNCRCLCFFLLIIDIQNGSFSTLVYGYCCMSVYKRTMI